MRICLVHEEYPEETSFGGIATYQQILAKELVKMGHSVYVISRSLSQDQFYTEDGVFVYRLFVEKSNDVKKEDIKYRQRVAQVLMDLQNRNLIDIIETPDWRAETIYFEKNRLVPLVVRMHTPLKIWLKYNQNDFGDSKNLILKWENKMLQSADLITCCSNILKKLVVKEFLLSPSQIVVTPNPANMTTFYRDPKIKKENQIVYVGSLEERKGVCILVKALNRVLEKYPHLKVNIIGKDTNRNSLNISTKELFYQIIKPEYKKNIVFIDHMPNKEINKYLNTARVAVFPSLFDNFPYVVLEAMLTGVQIVGSSNSGMVEMLNDPSSIYTTGDDLDLANKIIDKYQLSMSEEVNEANIARVKEWYDPKKVCQELLLLYEDTIKKYRKKYVSLQELQTVSKKVTDDPILAYTRQMGGVSNLVVKVKTKKEVYIIKKYFYDYDFALCNELYQKYKDNNINCIQPINHNIITYNQHKYNIFRYEPGIQSRHVPEKLFEKLMGCSRETKHEATLKEKCEKYYTYLTTTPINGNLNQEIAYVNNLFSQLKNSKILEETYLNHGDLSKSNIIINKKGAYIIDFDEVTVTNPLYDLAVITIKNLVEKDHLNYEKYSLLREKTLSFYKKYTSNDCDHMVCYYLCKILLEKFYLHQTGKIDLFSVSQKKDNYKRYLKILMEMDKNMLK